VLAGSIIVGLLGLAAAWVLVALVCEEYRVDRLTRSFHVCEPHG